MTRRQSLNASGIDAGGRTLCPHQTLDDHDDRNQLTYQMP